ncbi:MAG TPA: hypothetical protein VK525_08200 [Candidatus Saccharimonadales bacterium]|nr:hypothetical protein [Candidatus Saccharimonadales bacterium]
MGVSISKPLLGLSLGTVLGLLDGLSGFFEPSLAPQMFEVVTVSLGKGLLSGLVIGWVAERVHSLVLGIAAGVVIAGVLSYLVVLHAGPALLWDILLPGMLLGAIVGFVTQRYGRRRELTAASQ